MQSALAFSRNAVPIALQGAADNLFRQDAEYVARQAVSPFASAFGDKEPKLSSPNIARTFRDRFADALRRRVSPKTNLTIPVLADAIGVSDATIKNLLSKVNDPSARVIDGCIELFKDSFVNEIYGCHNIHCFDTTMARKADAMRRLHEVQEELRSLG